jgi:hypothetical protein
MRSALVTMLLGGLLGACMMSDRDGMQDSLRDARNEDQIYLAESRAAGSMSTLVNDVDRHAGHMNIILDDMRAHMSSMHHCSGMGSMMDLRDGMQTEVNDHRTTIHAMSDMTAARAEAVHHVTIMDDMLDAMGMQLDGMHCSNM